MRNIIFLLFPLIIFTESCNKPEPEEPVRYFPKHLFSTNYPAIIEGSIKCSDNKILVWGRDMNVNPMVMKLSANYVVKLWMTSYDRKDIETITSVAERQGGGFIACGTPLNGSHVIVLAVDENGEKLWTKTFADSLSDHTLPRIIRTYDGNCVIAVFCPQPSENVPVERHLTIIKIDAHGNEIWRKQDVDQSVLSISNMIEMKDHSIVLFENVNYGNDLLFFGHYDESGNRILRKKIERPGVYGMSVLNVSETSNGNLLVSGFQRQQLGGFTQGMVLRMSIDGSVINEEVYSSDTGSVRLSGLSLLDNDKYFAAGQATRAPGPIGYIYMVWGDENNNKIAEKLQPGFGDGNWIFNIHASDSGYILLGNHNPSMFAIGVDKQGRTYVNNRLE